MNWTNRSRMSRCHLGSRMRVIRNAWPRRLTVQHKFLGRFGWGGQGHWCRSGLFIGVGLMRVGPMLVSLPLLDSPFLALQRQIRLRGGAGAARRRGGRCDCLVAQIIMINGLALQIAPLG
jgi:hypothetical protein